MWILAIIITLPTLSISTAPVFSNFPSLSIPLREDIRVQTSFFKALATDADGDPIQFNILGPPGAPFVVNPVTGVVSVTPGLNFESINQYQLKISVNDSTQSVTRTLTVNIEDIDEPPWYNTLPSSTTLPENSVKLTVLRNVTATDPEGKPVTYTLVSPIGAPFDITPEGILTLRANPNLNFEIFQRYTLIIAATDGTLSTLSTFTVDITDVKEPPKILNMGSKITVPKDTSGNIFYPFAKDEDFQDKLTYSFITFPNTTDRDLFTQDPLTGGISVNCPPCLDPNEENLYEVYITVTDQTGHNTTGLLYVEVVDFMDTPEIINLPSTRFIFENRAKGELLFMPRPIDLTGGGRLSYQMNVEPPEGQFTIDTDTGYVYLRENPDFDYERQYKYELTIIVSNGVAASKPGHLYVRIADINEKPIINNTLSVFTLPEDTVNPIRPIIVKIKATDPDHVTTLTYEMKVEPPSGQDKFTVNPLNGEVKVAAVPGLDFESLNQYTLFVTASDGVLKSDPFQMTVQVTDANEPPFYDNQKQTIEIPEEMPLGSSLPVSCDARDPDSGDTVLMYQFMRSKHSDFFSLDSHNGCVIMIAKTIDSETIQTPDHFQLEITAMDTMGLSTSLSIEIKVNNINDNAPIFSLNNFEVELPENARVGRSVLDVSARDNDVGEFGKISYTICTSPGDYYFRVSSSGQVTLRASIDRETMAKLSFKIRSSDSGSPSRADTATVTVSILDSNDHRPTFIHDFYDFEAREDCSFGTSVGRISGTDDDSDTQELRYELLGISDEFEIDSVSGEIRTKGTLSPDKTYLLQAVVRDNGMPPETSRAVGIRVDTYSCRKSLVRMEVNQASVFFDTSGRDRFMAAFRRAFPGFKPGIDDVRSGEKTGTSVITIYFVRSNHTESDAAVAEKKKFVTVTEMIFSTTIDVDGTPNLRFRTGSFGNFAIITISSECEKDVENWWLDTEPGRVVLGVLSTVAGVLLLGALGYLGMMAASRCTQFAGFGSKGAGTGKVYPRPRGTLGKPQYSRFNDNQNWWKLKPKAAFDNPSALEEKFKPPVDRPISTSGIQLKSTPSRTTAWGRPLPGGETGLEF